MFINPFEGTNAIFKTIIIAIGAISVKLATMKKSGKKITFLTAFLSLVIGVFIAMIFHEPIQHYLPEFWQTIAIAIIAITGDNLMKWLVFTFNWNDILEEVEEFVKSWIKNKFN